MTRQQGHPAPAQPLGPVQVLAAGICALILTVGLARFAYTPLLPLMQSQAGLSSLAGGWLAAFNYMGYLSGALIAASAGQLQQKFHLYRIGLVLAVASTAAMGLTTDSVVMALLRYVSGVSSAAGMLIASGLVLSWQLHHGRRPELGMHFAGIGGGIVVSGVAVALMTDWLAWDRQWLALGMLGMVLFVPAWRWMPRPAAASAAAARHSAATPAAGRPNWMFLFMCAYFCAGFGYVVGATFIVAILEDFPGLAGHGAWIWVLLGLAAVPSSFLWDRVARAAGQTSALLLAYGLQIVSLGIPLVSGSLAASLCSAVLFGSTFVGIVSLTLALVGSRTPDNPAKAMARLTLSYGAAQIVAPAMTGYLAQLSGNYRDALLITNAVLCLGMLCLLVIRRRMPSA